MCRAVALAAVGLIGCGWYNVDPVPGGPDAPPVPAAICDTVRAPVDATPAKADLAIAPVSEGYAAIWVDAAAPGPARGVRLGPNLQQLGSFTLPGVTDLEIGGLADVGQKPVLATATGNTENLYVVSRDFSDAQPQRTLTQHVMGHDPVPSDSTQKPRAFVTGVANQIVTFNVADDGLVSPAMSVFTASGTIADLACTDGPNHSHCVWAETGPTRCTIADVYYTGPAPSVASTIRFDEDCREVRNASGPDTADSMIVVWSTPAHTVEAHYFASSGDVVRQISSAGSSPRVRFDIDGKRFWIAWLDGGGQLRLTSFDLNGTLVEYSLAGWTPRGSEAYEIVRRGSSISLVILSEGELDVLSICH